MRDTQTRVRLAYSRASIRQRRRRDSHIAELWAVCVAMLALDVMAICYVSVPRRYHSPEGWLYGATLLPSNAGSYVLVAIITFVVAVAVTVVCMKRHEKTKQEEDET